MNESLREPIETYLASLDGLIRRGCKIRDSLATDPTDTGALAALRTWQEDCGVAVNQLSGGSKGHWLARSFSDAFLMRSATGLAADEVPPVEIVKRLLGVLEQAVDSLTVMITFPRSRVESIHRFDFVHDPELRPIVERAYSDGQRALDQGDYELALLTACGILDAIVTDALQHKGLSALRAAGAPAGKIADWSFEMRLAVAEKAELIRSGCARLPSVARTYRDLAGPEDTRGLQVTVSEPDARRTRQVLRVVMRDLDPGR
jgi:hypothetical protein